MKISQEERRVLQEVLYRVIAIESLDSTMTSEDMSILMVLYVKAKRAELVSKEELKTNRTRQTY